MKSDLWVMFTITAGFMGFLMGYGVPPMSEVGLSAFGHHGGAPVEDTAESDASLEQFKELQQLLE